MVKKQAAAIMMAGILCAQSMPLFAATTAKKKDTTAATTEAAAEATTEFTWDDDNKDNAIAVWQVTDWKEYQARLRLSTSIGTGAHADVDESVRGLETTVRQALTSSSYTTDAEYEMEDYVELVLAMIQVLAEDCGVLGSESKADINSWIKDMGYLINPSYSGTGQITEGSLSGAGVAATGTNATAQGSVQMLFDSYMRSAEAFKEKRKQLSGEANKNEGKTGNEDVEEYLEPSIFAKEGDEWMSLKAVIEGTVMQYSADSYKKNYTWSTTMADKGYYSSTKAATYYKNHETQMEEYYSKLPEKYKDYRPSEDFAERVTDIYTVTKGTNAVSVSNASVQAFLNALTECEGLPYVWGANDGGNSDGSKINYAYDCSGLVSHACNKCGIYSGYKTSDDIHSWGAKNCTEITNSSDLQAGDILWRDGHVAVYISPGKTFEAWTKTEKVGYRNIDTTLGVKYTKAYRWHN